MKGDGVFSVQAGYISPPVWMRALEVYVGLKHTLNVASEQYRMDDEALGVVASTLLEARLKTHQQVKRKTRGCPVQLLLTC